MVITVVEHWGVAEDHLERELRKVARSSWGLGRRDELVVLFGSARGDFGQGYRGRGKHWLGRFCGRLITREKEEAGANRWEDGSGRAVGLSRITRRLQVGWEGCWW